MNAYQLSVLDHIVTLVIFGAPWLAVIASIIGFFKE